MMNARFEHLALNVSDMEAMADWYCAHLGMTKVRHDPGRKLFLADARRVVVLELYSNGGKPQIDLGETSSAALHLAFVVDEMDAAVDALVAAGCTVEQPIRTDTGDRLAMLRDPFGLALQLVEREKPLLE